MRLNRLLVPATAIVLLLQLTACGQAGGGGAITPPQSALTNEVAGVMVFDVQALSAEDFAETMATLEDTVMAKMPAEMVAQIKPQGQKLTAQSQESVDKYGKFRDAFIKAGGRGMVFGMIPPSAEGEEPDTFMLLSVKPGTDPAAMQTAMTEFGEGDGPEELTAYADGWLAVTDGPLNAAPKAGNDASAGKLTTALGGASGPVRIAFRMNESAKAALEAAKAEPQAAMLAGLIDPLMHLDYSSVVVTFGGAPAATAKMTFDSEQQAAQFNTVYAGLLAMGQGMLKQQVAQLKAQMPEAPEPAVVDSAFAKLQMKQSGNTLSMTLDKGFVGDAGQFAPMMLPMMMMMGGGMGGGMEMVPDQE